MTSQGVGAFDAEAVAPAVRLRAWADVTSRLLLPLQMWARTGTIGGRIEERARGSVAVSKYAASPHFGYRSDASIRSHPAPGLMKVAVVLRGSVTVRQGGSPVTLRPGEAAAYATWLPYAVGSDAPFEVLIALMPADLAGVTAASFDVPSARVLTREQTAPLRSWMLGAQSPSDRDRSLFGDRVHQALRGAATRSPERADADRLYREALALIHRRAQSRWMSPEYIAEVLGVSRRTLYSAFASETSMSVARTLRSVRLNQARDLLVRESGMPIGEVGRSVGYSDPAHFARAYRREFGRSAGEERAAGHSVQSGWVSERREALD